MRQLRLVFGIALLLATLAAECQQVDPDPSLIRPVGTALRVTAVDADGMSIAGARVYIDGTLNGNTPLFLDLDPGTYAVSVDTSGYVSAPRDTAITLAAGQTTSAEFSMDRGYYRTVVVEEFTNSDCQGCPETEALILDLTRDIPLDDVLTMSMHTRFPTPNDPMYVVNALAFATRAEVFYAIPGNPSVVIDGLLQQGTPPNEDAILLAIGAGRSRSSPVSLGMSYTLTGDQIDVDVTIRSVSDISGDLRLLVMTVQDDFSFDAPPGTNGQEHFVRVIRQFAPSTNGDPITISNDMDEVRHYTTSLLTSGVPVDDPDKLACAVVLQDWTSKSIVQATSTYASP